MKRDELPSPYEVARIAAALRGSKAATKPEEASRDALRLLLVAANVLNIEEHNRDIEAAKRREEMESASLRPDDEPILIRTTDNKSPALDWIRRNAEHERDKFKTERAFWNAWAEFEMADAFVLAPHMQGNVPSTIGELRRFLAWREEKRRTPDAQRQREKRSGSTRKGRGAAQA